MGLGSGFITRVVIGFGVGVRFLDKGSGSGFGIEVVVCFGIKVRVQFRDKD